MSEKIDKFSKDLARLAEQGNKLHMAIQYDCHPKEFRTRLNELFENDEVEITKYLESLPSFRSLYQTWYSESHAVIKQLLPDRLPDFVSYYEYNRPRKEITFQKYMIRDYLQGLVITRPLYDTVVVDGSAAIPEFVQQLNLLNAAKDTLASSLLDIKAILQADLFDTEIEGAAALLKAGYFRASGAICGVVIEKHLLHVCDLHNIKITKKNPGISDLNQLLRESDLISVPQWRFIQHLADIRNLCDHAKNKEPTKEEIADLISGSKKTLKTVF